MSQSLIAAVVVAALMLFASRAVAEYGYKIDPGPDVFSRESTSKKPKHGYSGWYKGPYSLYCDYERTPEAIAVSSNITAATTPPMKWVRSRYSPESCPTPLDSLPC